MSVAAGILVRSIPAGGFDPLRGEFTSESKLVSSAKTITLAKVWYSPR